jgi:hypothetical protein
MGAYHGRFNISMACSGQIKPDANIGGNIAAISEVLNEKTMSIL